MEQYGNGRVILLFFILQNPVIYYTLDKYTTCTAHWEPSDLPQLKVSERKELNYRERDGDRGRDQVEEGGEELEWKQRNEERNQAAWARTQANQPRDFYIFSLSLSLLVSSKKSSSKSFSALL